MGILYLGTQGYSYKDWVGTFYPARVRPEDYLAHYVEHFSAVELDSTFYGAPRPATVHGWYENTPPDFIFAAKFPRAITHSHRLINAEAETREFLEAMRGLREKCGPLVLQLDHEFGPEGQPTLDRFLGSLPADFRYAVDFRHTGWLSSTTWDLLAKHRTALCLTDLYFEPKLARATTDFVYVRWLGNRKQITRFNRVQIDRSRELAWWAGVLRGFLARGLDVYGFVNNCWSGFAPASAQQLSDLAVAVPRPD